MAKNINERPFDRTTKLKLDIFGECFEEWLPVFINDRYTDQVLIFDFFAGSGTDSTGYLGSPLILLDKARGKNKLNCERINKKIAFIFCEAIKSKHIKLKTNIEKYLAKCQKDNSCYNCKYNYHIIHSEFINLFNTNDIQRDLLSKDIGKFILLDQYGFKEIGEDVFLRLIEYPKTDFIFFISSSFIKRFSNHPNTKKYIATEAIHFDQSDPNKCHRIIANYFRQLVPSNKEYFIHHFTIQKEFQKGNYFGLIFGSNHTLGMEKFLKVCWKKDSFSGEANFNIDNNFEASTLFYDPIQTAKKTHVKKTIIDRILSGEIYDNLTGLKFSMINGCEPSLFTETIKELEKNMLIKRVGSVNNSSTNIHKVKQYFIKVST